MKKIVFATNNSHKLSEVRELLAGKYEVLSPRDVGFEDDVEESAQTLDGNALLKAQALNQATGLDCFADDTGLEVEALGMEPGVRSARYATSGNDPKANNELLLRNLEGVDSRAAQFRTVIALILDGQKYLFEGIVRGEITRERFGEQGFGYDPLFLPEGEAVTFAQMSSEAKGRISHRGRAIAKLVQFLETKR
ncbi:MAG: RdgB/HAM1 family non-canonical purine NTP pyrophosphatase [Rikenellaceae bacterium]